MIPLTNPNKKSIKSIVDKSFDPISEKCCTQCGIKKPIIAKGLCSSCYSKQWLKDNPEKHELRKIKQKEKAREWKLKNPEKTQEYIKNWRINNPERYKELRKAQNLRYLERHPEKKAESLKNLNERINKLRTCNILKKHAEEMKDDPEHLSTKFLQKLIGINCKKTKRK